MPQLRKLAPEEVQSLEDKGKGVRKLTEEQYDRAFVDFEVGDYGELAPDPEEKRLTARNRLKAAAQRRGLSLTFMRTTGEALRFKVGLGDGTGAAQSKPVRPIPEPEPEPEPEPIASDAPPKRKGGRPKKTA